MIRVESKSEKIYSYSELLSKQIGDLTTVLSKNFELNNKEQSSSIIIIGNPPKRKRVSHFKSYLLKK